MYGFERLRFWAALLLAVGVAGMTFGGWAPSKAAADSTNLALTATASATSVNPSNPVSHLNDGIVSTSYVSADNPSFPQYVTLTWPSGQKFNSVRISGWNALGQLPKNWDIQVSDDGATNWTTVASSGDVAWSTNDSTLESRTLNFSPVTNKKGVRLKINGAYLVWNHFAMNEMRVLSTVPPPNARSTLVFNLDQGFGNGIVVNNDQVALQRIIDAVQPLQTKYNVIFVLNPMVQNKTNLKAVLDTLAANGMSFLLEAASSDVETLGSCTDTFNAPADPYHGIAASISELTGYKTRYGNYFAGLRIFEMFGQDFTIRAVKTTDPDWALPCWKIPSDSFFQINLLAPYVAFADQHNMFVQWSDPDWYRNRTWDAPQATSEQQLANLLNTYPGRVIVTYANNEIGAPASRIYDWANAIQGFVDQGASGYGLSDQSWECGSSEVTCPASTIIDWARSGLSQGASYVQFEPIWYFFQLPRGSFSYDNYTTSPDWVNRGYATSNFTALKNALLGP
ncbi:discoidin domain-containing protein [Cohnella sp. REN36]|uniref:discoidin domain-containing protein n=1 Tax=Cohnella sp. REN36 TaxID=2887347 RepID=UPI001D138652|nr:discoidin domain-containing protein [Cohnella sp. REN36]MCC3373543.1 discoidin domain-containing protein [Cohnella sp. REN36]